MSYHYFVTDPVGIEHQAIGRAALNKVFADIGARFERNSEFKIHAVMVDDEAPQHIGDILGPILGDIQRSRKPGGRGR